MQNGIGIIRFYNNVTYGGDGLVMTKSVRICTYLLVLTRNVMVLNLNSSYEIVMCGINVHSEMSIKTCVLLSSYGVVW